MNPILKLLAVALVVGTFGGISAVVSSSALAQSQTQQVAAVQTKVFSVDNMTCALCPVTVKKAMEGVQGVRSVEIDFPAKTAKVAYDPTVVDASAIAAASTNAGYPARPVE